MLNGQSAATVTERLADKVVGQPRAIASIVPYLETYRAGLAPAGRPGGVFLLLGPTGTGKTRTVEVLAELLHGSPSRMLRIDCGEFQAEHEVAKLLGAPPGYVGHRESPPLLTQKRLSDVTSPGCALSLVLFDEIEKAAQSVATVLLGILDRAALTLGDGTTVDFQNTFIFLTSNLGARAMQRELAPQLGFRPAALDPVAVGDRLQSIGMAAVRQRFSPEFVNRLDAVITYDPLDDAARGAILDQQLAELQAHLEARLGERSFDVALADGGRRFLHAHGVTTE
jgi:ATP-dependent Clp protease ATP-binding subunit ClpA